MSHLYQCRRGVRRTNNNFGHFNVLDAVRVSREPKSRALSGNMTIRRNAMAIGLLGRKVGMTQIFDESGEAVPVTVIQAGPCYVLQLRQMQPDGYEAVQLGFGDKPRRLAGRSERGHVAKLDSKRLQKRRFAGGVQLAEKANCEPQRFVSEFRHSGGGYTIGQKLTVELLEGVKSVDVTGWKGAAPRAISGGTTSRVSGPPTALRKYIATVAVRRPIPSRPAFLRARKCLAAWAMNVHHAKYQAGAD